LTDLILTNANVVTLDQRCSNARTVAVRGGKIAAAGSDSDLHKLKQPMTRIIDCRGKTILPGFIDAHLHIAAAAESLAAPLLDSRHSARSISDIQAIVRTQAETLPEGAWRNLGGYHEFYLEEKRHPHRRDLDKAAPNHPVLLTHQTGHAHVLNSLALERVGLSKKSPDPPGGLIDRDYRDGEPTGLLFEMKAYLAKQMPPLKDREITPGIKRLNTELVSLGITSIQDVSPHDDVNKIKKLLRWSESGLLKPRMNLMLGAGALGASPDETLAALNKKNHPFLKGVKIILDETSGDLYPSQTELNQKVLKAHRAGLQVAIHAVEARAVEAACSAIAFALQKLPKPDHRHRIEHCSVCPPALSGRIASLGIQVVTQPAFIFYRGDRYLSTVPEGQRKHLYPIGTWFKKGVCVAGSSDFPFSPLNPIAGIFSAVSRMTEAGKQVLPEEKISPLEALRLYTQHAARMTFDEDKRGVIAPGKQADLIVLDKDPTQQPIHSLLDLKVEMTIIGGEIVWKKSF